jgi:hypothetical protein
VEAGDTDNLDLDLVEYQDTKNTKQFHRTTFSALCVFVVEFFINTLAAQ